MLKKSSYFYKSLIIEITTFSRIFVNIFSLFQYNNIIFAMQNPRSLVNIKYGDFFILIMLLSTLQQNE